MTQEQEQQKAKEVVATLFSKLIDSLEDHKVYTQEYGDHKFQIGGHNISFKDVFNLEKMDIVSYISYLFVSKQNKKYFGNADHETVELVFTQVYNKTKMDSLLKEYLN